ncbi:MAG: TonB-dependent receptor [Gemmatimonadaceae bacterium]|nr:TonB-dependent receptor [Gemmatimonadaceae bacterium]
MRTLSLVSLINSRRVRVSANDRISIPFRAGCLGVLFPLLVRAQASPPVSPTPDSLRTPLAAVRVTVSRDAARSPFELPFAIARVVPDVVRPGQRRTSVNDLVFAVPGVVVQERANPSQDPRLTMRGFGARSAFGVRGVRVMRDGIPLSLPDGQTPIDWLELESIGTLDVVRGTAAALYGNAAGGVLDIHSREPVAAPVAGDLRWWSGGGLTRQTATLSAMRQESNASGAGTSRLREPGAFATITRTTGDGARAWSRVEASHAFGRAFARIGHTRVEVQGTHYDNARAENTGALTASEMMRDVTLPDSLNITKRSRKAVQHQQAAVIVEHGNAQRSVQLNAFAGTRTLDNPLPFAVVAVDRSVVGGAFRATVRLAQTPWPLRLTAGVDAQRQDDSRLNFENCADVVSGAPTARCPQIGVERGATRLDQREEVSGLGSFVRAEVEAPHAVFVSVAARHDRVGFRVSDRFVTASNADDSGERTLSATTPMVGVVWRARPTLSVFGNWTSAFETPTVTELTNQETGAAGLNSVLEPQYTRTVEAGLQAIVRDRVRLDVAAFRAIVQDELVPFDVPNAPGRRAFRNAGQTSRRGLEASALAMMGWGDLGASYTRSHFRFDQYVVGTANYAGKVIPGIPAQLAQLFATSRYRGWFGTVEATMATRMAADDAGAVQAGGYSVWALRGGYAGTGRWGRLGLEPTLGIDNLFDRRFATSVVVNATRGRYFEPALPRRAFASVRVTAR